MDDGVLVIQLQRACETQLALYRAMCGITEKMLQRLVLSRGDMTGFKEIFERKRLLMAGIERERSEMRELADRWQQRKSKIGHSEQTRALDGILGDMETVISRYLELEAQVRTYLEHAVAKTATADNG